MKYKLLLDLTLVYKKAQGLKIEILLQFFYVNPEFN